MLVVCDDVKEETEASDKTSSREKPHNVRPLTERHRMVLLTFLLILVLQCEVGLSETEHVLYLTPGNDVIMPCDNVPDTCSMIIWAYSSYKSQTINMAHNGIVEKNSAQAARLSLLSSCSLSIKNITAEDAGQYFCRPEGTADQDTTVYLNILTISAFPSDADPMEDGNVTLECSLFRYYATSPCNSMRWVDETGSVLWDRGVKNTGRTCVSLLTVKLQSGNKKRYTCQFEDNNTVKIEAHYTPVLTDTPDRSFLNYIMWALRFAGLTIMIVITVLVIRHKGRKKPPEDTNVRYVGDRDEDTVNYENVRNRTADPELD